MKKIIIILGISSLLFSNALFSLDYDVNIYNPIEYFGYLYNARSNDARCGLLMQQRSGYVSSRAIGVQASSQPQEIICSYSRNSTSTGCSNAPQVLKFIFNISSSDPSTATTNIVPGTCTFDSLQDCNISAKFKCAD